jgi:chromatin assembly factor 1 subunit B
VAAPSASGIWRQVGLLRGHCDDVLDLAWAPAGSSLLSGGIENNCMLWDVEGRKSLVGGGGEG